MPSDNFEFQYEPGTSDSAKNLHETYFWSFIHRLISHSSQIMVSHEYISKYNKNEIKYIAKLMNRGATEFVFSGTDLLSLSEEFIKILLADIDQLQKISFTSEYSHKEYPDAALEEFINFIKRQTQLKYAEFSFTNFSNFPFFLGKLLAALSPELENLSLRGIKLEKLTPEQLKSIFDCLASKTKLKEIDLLCNSFNRDHVMAILNILPPSVEKVMLDSACLADSAMVVAGKTWNVFRNNISSELQIEIVRSHLWAFGRDTKEEYIPHPDNFGEITLTPRRPSI